MIGSGTPPSTAVTIRRLLLLSATAVALLVSPGRASPHIMSTARSTRSTRGRSNASVSSASISTRRSRSRSMSSLDTFESVTNNWTDGFDELREAIAHLLLDPRLVEGVRCTPDQLVTPLNSLGGHGGQEELAFVDVDMIHTAFKGCGKEFWVSYEEMGIAEGGDKGIYIRMGKQIGSSAIGRWRCYDFGVYDSEIYGGLAIGRLEKKELAESKEKQQAGPFPPPASEPHPLGHWAAFQRGGMSVPQRVKDKLRVFLSRRKTGTTKRKTEDRARETKQKKRERENPPDDPPSNPPREIAVQPASAQGVGPSEEESSTPGEKRKSPPEDVQQPPNATITPVPGTATMEPEPKRARRSETDDAEADEGPSLADLYGEYNSLATMMSKLRTQIQEKEMASGDATTGAGKANVKPDKSSTLYYIHKSRLGKVQLDNESGILHYTDLAAGLVDLPAEIDNPAAEKTRERTNYEMGLAGNSMCWVPGTHDLKIKNRQAEVDDRYDIVKRINELFKGEISTWSHEAKRIMMSCSLFGYGCSDEGTIMIMAGAVKALFHEVGIEISNRQIANAFPSRATFATMEVEGAADCLIGTAQEMKEDEAEDFGLTCDHGHRQRQDHFVKLFSWAGKDENGDWTIKFHCLDVDSSGHSAKEAALAIKVSTEQLLELLSDLTKGQIKGKVQSLTADMGGGASAKNLDPVLRAEGTMGPGSKTLGCDMHNWVKPLEIGCADAWGRQGRGHKTPFQMVWLFVNILKQVRKNLGRKGLDEIWKKVIEKLRTDTAWRKLANEHCKYAFDDFMKMLEKLEEEDAGAAEKLTTEAPANVQDPVFTRWGTMLAAVKLFTDKWIVIYFFAVALKGYHKQKSYLWQCSCALLSLMNNKSKADMDGMSLDDFIESFDWDDDSEEEIDPPALGSTPIFLAVLQFLNGFNEAYFDDMYNYLMQNDPVLGKNTFGQMARFGPERVYWMHKALKDIENGGWKTRDEFKPFVKSLKGIGGGDYGIEYFKTVTAVFFERFRFVFEKHMVAKWRSSHILHYMLGGQEDHAQQLALWLVDYKERMNADGESEEGLDAPPFVFPDREVLLGKHHQMSSKDRISVNLRESMEYITAEADREEMLKDAFVVEHWDLIEQLAASEQPVQLLTKRKNGKLDKTTWNGVDYEPLVIGIWKKICIHSSHQQRCENYVQLCGLLSLTGVAQVRRSCRGILIGTMMRRFNVWGLEKKHKMQRKEHKRKRDEGKNEPLVLVDRLQGSDKTFLYFEFLDSYWKRADKGKASITPENYKKLIDRLKDPDAKASARELKTKLEEFEKSLKKAPKTYKAELPAGVEKTARVKGAVYLRILTKTNGMEGVVVAEIKARKILVSENTLKSLTIAEKRKLLREDELKRRIGEELKESDIQYIKPVSKELIAIMKDGTQQKILDKEAGIIAMEEEG